MRLFRPAMCLAFSGLIGATAFIGCRSRGEFVFDHPHVGGPPSVRRIEMASIDIPPAHVATSVTEPLTIGKEGEPEDWFLTLEEVIQITLANSDVIRDIGGRVVTTPQAVNSIYDVALQEIDPQFGVEAALSEFDAQVATSLFLLRDERTPNNPITSGGAFNSFGLDTGDFNIELSKQSVAGTRYALRNVTDYSRLPPNLPNRFPSWFNTSMEAEFRHPLLRGRGIDFNRIAGPNARPGNYNGVVLARIRTDIALADFEASVRNLLRDVETAYIALALGIYLAISLRGARYGTSR